MPVIYQEIWVPLVIFGVLWLTREFHRARRPNRPGPPGLPIIGNLHQMSPRPYLLFSKWAEQYGDVFYLKMGQADWMVLSSPEAIHDILVKHGTTFSHRPYQEIPAEILTKGCQGVLNANYGSGWRSRRKILSLSTSKAAVRGYMGFLTHEGRELCKVLYKESQENGPSGFSIRNIALWHSLNVTLSVTYGTRIQSHLDPRVQQHSNSTEEAFNFGIPEAYPADLLSFLWPFFGHKRREAQRFFEKEFKIQHTNFTHYLENRGKVDAGIPTTICKHLADAIKAQEFTTLQAYILLGETMVAGLHTTSLSLTWIVHILATRLDVQERVHAEMDRVIGKSRLPTITDVDDMPYFRCVLQECLRFRGPSQFLLPRTNIEDIEHQGVLIKKGTWIISNIHAIHGVGSRQESAEEFRPERWETNPKTLSEEAMGKQGERESWTFGGGRRVCAGLHLAEADLYLATLHILWAFHLRAGDGETIDLDEVEDGLINPPPHRRIQYIPRSPDIHDLLMMDDSSSPAENL